ncbi:AmmeMemoRadiSam system protein B [Candidatus Falkowbacteria bacterium]|nr:AmmeMemoRadiSam system protein B [Candidatus Falkowbacteria bacterium]
MLVFSAIVPHPPILIPNVGKENLDKLKKTISALEILENDLLAARPDMAIIISPHGEINFNAFTINTNQIYKADFRNFGDFATKLQFKPDLEFINALRGKNETTSPMKLISSERLDHGSAVPLYYLLRRLPKTNIVPINYCFLSYEKHLEFGAMIKETIFSSDKRCALIASGDLSHRLSLRAPAGFSPQAKEFDKKLMQLLKKKNADAILNLDPKLIEEAGECGLRSILILLGAIKEMNFEFEILSYEAPFGVGYLVGEFRFA